MKFCILVASLFFVTISSLPTNLKRTLFKNPKLFVKSVSKADEETVNKMIEFITQVIADGNNEIIDFTTSRDEAQTDFNNKEKSHAQALLDESTALDLWNEGKNTLIDLQSVLAEANKLQLADKQALDNAIVDRDAKKRNKDEESERIDNEFILLNEVKDMLNDINSKAMFEMRKNKRNLLNVIDYKAMANADPDSIKAVLDLVDALIQAGEDERAAVIKAWQDAVDVYGTANDAYDLSNKDWKIAIGAVDKQKDANVKLADAHAASVTARESATQAASDSADELSKRSLTLDVETKRINEEAAICREALNLLETLLTAETEDSGP